MGKTYKMANGREVDFQKLMLKNENVRAVGNMNVNARGDVISPENKKVATRSEQVNKQYRKQIGNVVVDAPANSQVVSTPVAPVPQVPAEEEKIIGLDEIAAAAEVVEIPVKETPARGGLASAIAKAKNKDK